jgi:hypothetical protein
MSLVRKLAARSVIAVSLAGLGFCGLGVSVAQAATTASHSVVHVVPQACPCKH